MIIHRLVEFDESEAREIRDALIAGIIPPSTVEGDTWDMLRRFRNRVESKEQFTHDQLVTADDGIDRLIEHLAPQADADFWRKLGAPGPDDTLRGLALERELQIDRLVDVQAVVHYARVLIAPNRSIEQEVV